MRLADPWLLLLLGTLLLLLPRGRRVAREAAVRYPSLAVLRAIAPGGAGGRRVVLGSCARRARPAVVGWRGHRSSARPRPRCTARSRRRAAVNVSGSMLAEDFTIDGKRSSRLDAVKDVVRQFVADRPQDRIGLVLFAGRPYTQAPLTLDHGWLLQNLARASVG